MAKAELAPDPSEPTALPLLALLWFATLSEVSRHDHIVKDLLLAQTLFVVYGESNCGKTFWLINLALTMCRGDSWRGRRCRKGLVIYVAGEGSTSVRNRVAAYRITNPEVPGGLPFAIIPFAVDFLDPEAVGVLIATIRAAESECGEKVVLVCIDTFARAVAGGDENSAQDVGVAVAGADRIRNETGACVGFVHHCGKDATKGARGSSALRAAVDTEIMIEGVTGQRCAIVTKQRDLESGQRLPFELVPVEIGTDPEDETAIHSCVVKHLEEESATAPNTRELRGKAQRQILAALRARAQTDPDRIWTLMDLRQVGREIGLNKGTARSAVDALTTSPYMRATIGGYRFTDGRVEG
jgi:putative DNA primase/helicase